MRICFKGKTNKDYVMVNTATFKLENGGTITVDRDMTEYTIESGKLEMVWDDCYLWAVNGVNLFNEPYYPDNDAFIELLDGATLQKLELEDDADEDYKITGIRWSVG